MSPYDDGWLSGSLHELAVEITLNDPRREIIAAQVMKCLALVCSHCHVILKRQEFAAATPPPELAYDHHHCRGVIDDKFGPWCRGGQRPAVWHGIAYDTQRDVELCVD